ncbi:hypothetical protein [Nocardioides marmorisolisilvae]|uniref:hypothetical protein n=1 Tax=Nocardioides marmorisolisilvae TaxID=1542737 RepID=UPI0016224E48|nr:hypothetical protein [Nocardioides marmorisolisilvae]
MGRGRNILGDFAVGGVFVGVVFMCVTIFGVIALFFGVLTGILDFPMPIPGR